MGRQHSSQAEPIARLSYLGLTRTFGLAYSYAVGLALYLGKLATAGVLLGIFEMSIAKMRVFRVPNFLGIALMLGLLGVLLRFVSEGM